MGIAQHYFLPAALVALVCMAGCGTGSGGASFYQATGTIQVTITNQSTQTISFADHRTNCTVIQLERQVANSWEAVAPCQRMIATRLHTLHAGQAMEVTLTAPDHWPGGLYRARLDYLLGAEGGAGAQKAVVSREFRIG
jgi:hypothetical protein